MNVHQITLSGYTASAGTDANCVSGLYLGTAGSYGVEQLDVVQSAGWENLSVTAIFQPCGVKITVPAEGGAIDVPWEATADALPYPQGRIVFQGYADGELINTCDIVYTVSGHSATAGTGPQPPTPDQYQQFVKEVQASAEAAANSATEAAGSASAAAGSASAAAGSAQQAADTLRQVQEAGQQATEAIGTAQSDAIKAVSDAQSAAVQAVQGQQQTSVGAVQAAGTAAVDQVSQAGQQQVQAVKDEGTAQIGAVAEAGSAQVQAVQQAGAQQITDIGEAGAQQVQAVNTAGDTKLDQINTAIAHPPQPNTSTGFWQVWNAESGKYEDTTALYQGGYYTPSVAEDGTLTWTGSQAGMPELPSANIRGPQGLGVPTPSADAAGQVPTVNAAGDGYLLTGPYAPLEASIRPTANGNPAVCEDSVAWSFQGLRIYGKSTQDGTPSPENPVPIVSAGEGGSVELNVTGANLLDISGFSSGFANGVSVENQNGVLVYNGQMQEGINISVNIAGSYSNRNPLFTLLPGTYYVKDVRIINMISGVGYQDAAFTLDAPFPVTWVTSKQFLASTVFANNLFYPMLNVGESALPWQPYVSQSLPLSTPSGLPGIPVDSGGNYVDGEGQQWASDVKDLGGKTKTQNVLDLTFDGSADENWILQSGVELGNRFRIVIRPAIMTSYKGSANSMNNLLPIEISGATSNTPYCYTIVYDGSASQLYVALSGTESLEEFKAYLQENPMRLLARLITPITSPLSAEELAAYRALTTHSGTTVVSTAEPVAGIEARYILDGTAAWNKVTGALAQLSAANTQTSQVVNTMLGASE